MKVKFQALLVFILFLTSSCHRGRGSKDFGDAMFQSERIAIYAANYKKMLSRDLSGVEIRKLIEKDASIRNGDFIIKGWTFYEAGSTYIATKYNVQNAQGGYYDIYIYPNLECDWKLSKK